MHYCQFMKIEMERIDLFLLWNCACFNALDNYWIMEGYGIIVLFGSYFPMLLSFLRQVGLET